MVAAAQYGDFAWNRPSKVEAALSQDIGKHVVEAKYGSMGWKIGGPFLEAFLVCVGRFAGFDRDVRVESDAAMPRLAQRRRKGLSHVVRVASPKVSQVCETGESASKKGFCGHCRRLVDVNVHANERGVVFDFA